MSITVLATRKALADVRSVSFDRLSVTACAAVIAVMSSGSNATSCTSKSPRIGIFPALPAAQHRHSADTNGMATDINTLLGDSVRTMEFRQGLAEVLRTPPIFRSRPTRTLTGPSDQPHP